MPGLGGRGGRLQLAGVVARAVTLVLLAGQVLLLAGDRAAVAFVGAMIPALAVRLGWRRALLRRRRSDA